MSAQALIMLDWPRVKRALIKAELWSSEAEDVLVEAGKYSAMHWALKSQAATTTPLPLTGQDGLGVVQGLKLDSDAKTIGDGLAFDFVMHNVAQSDETYAQFIALITDPATGLEHSDVHLKALNGGVMRTFLFTDADAVKIPLDLDVTGGIGGVLKAGSQPNMDLAASQVTETSTEKIFTSLERTKLVGIAEGATANVDGGSF